MANINKIRLSGQTYNIQDLNASKTVELTQAQYDALTVKDPNTFYVITDAQGADLSNYYTKSETSGATEISTALNAKQDTLVSGTNIKTINNESILGSGNITIQGGGSSYTAGTGIDITNDVISVTGKVDTTTYETYTAATATAIGNKLATSDFNTYSGTVDTAINSKASQSDLSTLSGTVTAHTANTDIHVTTAQTAAWDAKQNALTIDSTVTSGSTNPVQGGAVYSQLGGLKLIKLTQNEYDNLSPNYDSNTLYIIKD